MSIRMKPIRTRADIENIKESDECLYVGFRPSNQDIINIIRAAPELNIVCIPESYSKTLSKSMTMLLEMKEVKLMIGGVQGNENVESCFVLNEEALDVDSSQDDEPPVEENNQYGHSMGM